MRCHHFITQPRPDDDARLFTSSSRLTDASIDTFGAGTKPYATGAYSFVVVGGEGGAMVPDKTRRTPP